MSFPARVRGSLLLVTLCLVAAALLAQAPPAIAGRWLAEIAGPLGPADYVFTFEVRDGEIAGTARSELGETALGTVRLDGDRLSFTEVRTFNGREIRADYVGTVAGDEIRFERTTAGTPPLSFVARRMGVPAPRPGPYPFQDASLPDDRRLADLVSRMTLDEKILALGTSPRVTRLGVTGTRHVEGIHGLAYGGPSNWGSRNPMPTTIFPQGVGLGETWDVDALREVGRIEGYEARFIAQSPRWYRGGLIVRVPNSDLARDIRWGRAEESYGEDAFLAGTLSVALIKGLQGDDAKHWQAAALLKHLLANSNEDGRSHSSSDFDERLLREYYSVPFRMGIVEGHADAFMAAYNSVNGIPCTVQPFLREMTMKDWGLDGIICTDGGALTQLVTEHKTFPDLASAAAASLKAGITVFLDRYPAAVREALDKRLIAEADIDAAVVRNMRISLRLGLLDPPEQGPYGRIGLSGDDPWQSDAHKTTARQVTRKSIVLLRNEKGLLPLDRTRLRSLAVIGPRSDRVLLDWYSGTPPYTVSPLDGIREAVGAGVRVTHVPDDPAAAEAAARASDVAIVIVGNHPVCDAGWEKCPDPSEGKEAVDRKDIVLNPAQQQLLERVVAANPRTVLVVRSSFPYAISWAAEHVPAILHMAHNSQEEGHALADVLFGDYNPAGRLVHTWVRSLADLPPMMDYDLRHGRTYMYFAGTPLYPFGFGLSYTTFAYSHLRVEGGAVSATEHATVTVTVRNTGARAGEEVVQLYAAYPGSRVPRPKRQLVGFARVPLAAGESRDVSVVVQPEALAYWDVAAKHFTVEPGTVRFEAGASSADIRQRVTVPVK